MHQWWDLDTYACQPADARRWICAPEHAQPASACTHADFVALVQQWLPVLQALPQQRIALFEPNPMQFCAALWAIFHAGKTAVLPGDTQCATLAALDELGCARLGTLPAALALPAPASSAVMAPSAPPADAAPCASIAAAKASPLPRALAPLDAGQVQLSLFTSGTQGAPQRIDKSLRQLQEEVRTLQATFAPLLQPMPSGQAAGCGDALYVWSTVSHQHIYGLLFYLLWSLCSGRIMAQPRLAYPEDMARQLTRACLLVATPAHLRRLDETLPWQHARQHVKGIFSSGGPMPLEAAQTCQRIFGQLPFEVFGSSETGGIAWRQSHSHDTPWNIFARVQWRMEDDVLHVRSPNLADDNWFATADRISPEGDHSFRLLGRADRIVKIEEKRISLTAIEARLHASALVQEARAIAIGTRIGQRIGVVLAPSAAGFATLAQQGRRAFIAALRAWLAPAVEAVALPRRWRVVASLPVNSQGKIPHILLEELLQKPQPALNLGNHRATEAVSPAPAANVQPCEWPALPAITWHNRQPHSALASLHITPDLPVLQGHFPAAAIVPGVAQLDWALTLGHAAFDLPGHFAGLQAFKLVKPIIPPAQIWLALECRLLVSGQGQGPTPSQSASAAMPAATHALQFRIYSLNADGHQTVHGNGTAHWCATMPANC